MNTDMSKDGVEPSSDRRRIDAALHGQLPLRDLTCEERAQVNSELDAAIQGAVSTACYRTLWVSRGHPVVGLDDHGSIVHYLPDGTPRAQ